MAMNDTALITTLFLVLMALGLLRRNWLARRRIREKLQEPFPLAWRKVLEERVHFYKKLSPAQKMAFQAKVQRFIASKEIKGVETTVEEETKVLVAASATIPTLAFPDFDYPRVREVLLYPNSFDSQFQTARYEGHEEHISGMVGGGMMHGTVLLSKADLEKAFDGMPHPFNVGIHEFAHLLDMADGAADGVPEHFLPKPLLGPWIEAMKHEHDRILLRRSDLNPYALTSHAEFFAVATEYFFGSPRDFCEGHAELYKYLSMIFGQQPDRAALLDISNQSVD